MKNRLENKKESLYIRVIEFALESPDGFTYSDIIESTELSLTPWEVYVIDRFFYNANQRNHHNNNTIGETIFLQISDTPNPEYKSKTHKYILTFESEFTFIDYLELKFARENAKEAQRFSRKAIRFSVIAIIVSALVPFIVAWIVTQNIKVDNTQFQEIKNTIESVNTKK
jgi:hypothetical protein